MVLLESVRVMTQQSLIRRIPLGFFPPEQRIVQQPLKALLVLP
jgi:hypothetical protein